MGGWVKYSQNEAPYNRAAPKTEVCGEEGQEDFQFVNMLRFQADFDAAGCMAQQKGLKE